MDDVRGVRNREEMRGANHPCGNPAAELLNLAADILEECVAFPAPDEHDGEDGYLVEVHRQFLRGR